MSEITRRAVLTRGTMAAVAAYLGASAVRAASQSPRLKNAKFKSIDAAIQRAVNDRTVAGAVAMAATQKGIIYEGLFGKANVETGTAMTPDTVFWLLSMTKTITATAHAAG
jgi:CubicO group peptidase (beta-lactamase class C family)